MKKYLKIASGIIVLIIIIVGGYLLWKNVFQELIFPSNSEAPVQSTAITPISDGPIFDYWINGKNNGVYFLNPIGQTVRVADTNRTVVNSQTLDNLHAIQPSFDGAYVVAEFNYPQLPTFSIFNTATNNWQPLPTKTHAAAWSPTTQEIAYIDGITLKILNLINQKSRDIVTIAQKDIRLYWVSQNKIFFAERSAADFGASLWSLDINTKTVTPLIKNQTGLLLRWYPKSDFGLQFHTERNKPILGLIDKNAALVTTASFTTLPSKCLIEGDILYCAVPKVIPDGLIWPDDYDKKSVFFEDAITIINLAQGSVQNLTAAAAELIDAEHLEKHGNRLLFINRLDRKLYAIQL